MSTPSKISEILSDDHADIFTDFATITRYPDKKEDFTETEMNFALKYSEAVFESVEKYIDCDVRSDK